MIHHLAEEVFRVAEVVEEQVWRLGGQRGAAGKAGADGYGKSPDAAPAPIIV